LVKSAKIKYDKVPISTAKNLAFVREQLITVRRLNIYVGFVIHVLLILLGYYFLQVWYDFGKFTGNRQYDFWQIFDFFASYILIANSLHPIAHLIAGVFCGIGFKGFLFTISWYPASLELDYESYLNAGSTRRKILHLSGVLEAWTITIYYSYIAFNSIWTWILPICILLLYIAGYFTKNKKLLGDVFAFQRERRNSILYKKIRILKVKEAIKKK